MHHCFTEMQHLVNLFHSLKTN